MKPSKILRAAAELVEERRKTHLGGGCFNICIAGGDSATRGYDSPEVDEALKYFILFKPKDTPTRSYWFGDPLNCTKKLHARRILALLFAAAMAESDGR